MPSGLSVRRDGDILHLSLFLPEKSNAFGLQEAKALSSALRQHASAAAVVFSSGGSRFFCAGGDMQHYAGLKSRAQGLLINRRIGGALAQLAAFPAPTLALVNGDCLGGGLELLSAFDEIWCSPAARFGFWQRRIGLSFGWGGYARLRRRLSDADVRRLSLQAADISAFEAHRLGLVDRLVAPPYEQDALAHWIKNLGAWPRSPHGILKALKIGNETRLFARLWHRDEHRRALEAFQKRRKRT